MRRRTRGSNEQISLLHEIPLGFTLVLAFLLTLTVDFDRPADGLVRVPQTVILDTIAQMEAEMGEGQ